MVGDGGAYAMLKKNEAETKIAELNERIEQLTKQKDNAYWERNQLVCALSKIALSLLEWDAWLTRHPDEDKDWEDDWRNIVVIVQDGNQMTWHIHDSELPMYAHLQGRFAYEPYDGHSTEEKYRRLAAI